MTCRRSCLFAIASTLVIASCAQPAPENHAARVAVKKTVRMNSRGKVTSISLSDLFALQQSGKVLLFDARPAFFHGLNHIAGAISLPKPDCDTQIAAREAEIKAALAAGKTIVVYCTNLLCPDARTVAIHLADFGYSSSVLSGGWDAWKESCLPTE